MPNALAYAVVIASPVIVALLFTQLRLQTALLWSIIGSYLLLPERIVFRFPMVPDFDKLLLPASAAFVMCILFERSQAGYQRIWRPAGWIPDGWLIKLLLLIFIIQPVFTVLTNSDPFYVAGGTTVEGLRLYDAGNAVYNKLPGLVVLLLARRYLRTDADLWLVLRVLMIAGLAYSLPVLAEVRLSPQINRWIYGFTQFSFLQQMRGGGFRPVVFLNHGLWTAIVMALSAVAATAVWRLSRGPGRPLYGVAAVWLLGVLMLCRSLGALAIGFGFALVTAFAGRRLRMAFAGLVCGMVLLYPMLRGAGLVPTEQIVATAATISEQRAESLEFRFVNEQLLLDRANERPLLGWGGFGRSRIYDPVSGRDISVTDGRWVIIFGVNGWLGYIAEFGLLTLPVFLLAVRNRRRQASNILSLTAVVLSANLLDLLLNDTILPITWLLTGAVIGRIETLGHGVRETESRRQQPQTRRRRALIGDMAHADASARHDDMLRP